MTNEHLCGKRYINVLRCSTSGQKTEDDQKKINDAFAKQSGMVWVRDEVMDGVSASTTDRPDLDALLVEHDLNKNFDVVLVHDYSRLTRGGIAHDSKVREQFRQRGVLVVSATEPLPEGELGELVAGLYAFKNKEHVTRLAHDITRGIGQYIMRGDCEHHGKLSYGIDRVYVRMDGTPFLRLVYGEHGFRYLLEEPSQKLIREFDPAVDENTAYRKMKGEKVLLVPSDESRINVIRKIFGWRYTHRWPYTRIARELNNSGVKPPHGLKWRSPTIRSLTLQPMYLGWSYVFKTVGGKMWEVTSSGPASTTRGKGKRAKRERSLEELAKWYRTHPHLQDFIIDAAVRERAEAAIHAHYRDRHIRRSKQHVSNVEQHPTTISVLRDVLTEATTGLRLVPRNGKRRYYAINAAGDLAATGHFLRRGVPAAPLEDGLFSILRFVFAKAERLQTQLARLVAQVQKDTPEAVDHAKLAEESRQTARMIDVIYETCLTPEQLERRKDQIARLQERLETLKRELAARPVTALVGDAPAIAEKIHQALIGFSGSHPDYAEKLRKLINVVCDRFVVNLETGQAEVEISLPAVLVRIIHQGEMDVIISNLKDHFANRDAHRISLGIFRLTPSPGWPDAVTHFIWAELTTNNNTQNLGEAA